MTAAHDAILLVLRIAAAGAVIASVELLVVLSRPRERRLLDWEIARLRRRWMVCGPLAPVLDRLLGVTGTRLTLTARALAALALAAAPASLTMHATAALALVVAVMSALVMLRTPYGNDGADQMSFIIVVTAAAALAIGSDAAMAAGLLFIAFQLCLSYAAAGVAKLFGEVWRRGEAVGRIFMTRSYGVERWAPLVQRHHGATRMLTWSIVTLECVFPLALVAPRSIALPILAGGLLFHAGSALVMGLNAFLFAFAAAYPALIYTRVSLLGAAL